MGYLAKESEWDQLSKFLETYTDILGLDSEFEGVDFSEGDSCVNKANITVWSLGILSNEIHPRGYRKAKGCVLPRSALEHRGLRKILTDSARIKAAHNSNVDVHAFNNAGVDVLGVVNTLSLARWMVPGEIQYNLNALGEKYLGVGKTEEYKDIFRTPNIIEVVKQKKSKVCSCGVPGCRKRKDTYSSELDDFIVHTKTEQIEETVELKEKGFTLITQTEILAKGPGHPLFDRFIAYAQRDATLAASLYDYLVRLKTETEIPWYNAT